MNLPCLDHLLKRPVALLTLAGLTDLKLLRGPDKHVIDMWRLFKTCWLTMYHAAVFMGKLRVKILLVHFGM